MQVIGISNLTFKEPIPVIRFVDRHLRIFRSDIPRELIVYFVDTKCSFSIMIDGKYYIGEYKCVYIYSSVLIYEPLVELIEIDVDESMGVVGSIGDI